MEEYRTNSPFVKRVSAKQTGYSKSTFGILSDNGHSGKAEESAYLEILRHGLKSHSSE